MTKEIIVKTLTVLQKIMYTSNAGQKQGVLTKQEDHDKPEYKFWLACDWIDLQSLIKFKTQLSEYQESLGIYNQNTQIYQQQIATVTNSIQKKKTEIQNLKLTEEYSAYRNQDLPDYALKVYIVQQYKYCYHSLIDALDVENTSNRKDKLQTENDNFQTICQQINKSIGYLCPNDDLNLQKYLAQYQKQYDEKYTNFTYQVNDQSFIIGGCMNLNDIQDNELYFH